MFKQLMDGMFHSKWTFLRLLQLFLSVMVLIQAITDEHYLLIIPAVFILYMALSNSCAACRVPASKHDAGSGEMPEEIEYIEINKK